MLYVYVYIVIALLFFFFFSKKYFGIFRKTREKWIKKVEKSLFAKKKKNEKKRKNGLTAKSCKSHFFKESGRPTTFFFRF